MAEGRVDLFQTLFESGCSHSNAIARDPDCARASGIPRQPVQVKPDFAKRKDGAFCYIMSQNFSLIPKGNGYCMKREGEQSSVEFETFHKALAYARNSPASLDSRVVIFDCFGTEMMSFPARLPEKAFARLTTAKGGR